MPPVIMAPGIGNSGAHHWQTYWEKADSRFQRFCPDSWDNPRLANWQDALDRAILSCETSPYIVAHSLACLLVCHWAKQEKPLQIAGAFLVAPPDPDGPIFPEEAVEFSNIKPDFLPFPSRVIASANDPYATVSFARTFATKTGSDFELIGSSGHINAVHDWPMGRELFWQFVAKAKIQ